MSPSEAPKCTHVDCEQSGIGRVAETSEHWLCELHLTVIKDAIATWYRTGDIADMKKMIGITVRSSGGAKQMTSRMLGDER